MSKYNDVEQNNNESHKQPLVSVVITTFNLEKYIEQAINSVITQECDYEFEILIIDDASTDKTQEILKRYNEKYPFKINLIIHNENQLSKGIWPCRFYIGNVKGKYIALLDGDDYWTDPKKLEKQVSLLEAYPQYIASYHFSKTINENEEEIEYGKYKRKYPDNIFTRREGSQFVLPAQTSSVVYRNFWPDIDPKMIVDYLECKTTNDSKLAAILVSLGNIYVFDTPMSVYRLVRKSGNSQSAIKYRKNNTYNSFLATVEINNFTKRWFDYELIGIDFKSRIFARGIKRLIKEMNSENFKTLYRCIKDSDVNRCNLICKSMILLIKGYR